MNSRLNKNFQNNNYSITYEQWQILSRLYDKDGLTQNQIAMKVERDQASVSRLIDNMVKRDLVKRMPHPSDRRIKCIYLTEESKEIENEVKGLALKTIAQASGNLSQEELETCLKALDQIRKNLE